MFKKYYKEAYDDIKTNRALIPDIFEKAEKSKKPVSRIAVYRFASCAAAVFALCAILYLYPHMDIKNPPSGTERAAENISALPGSDAEDTEQPKIEKIPNSSAVQNSEVSDTVGKSEKTADNKLESKSSNSGSVSPHSSVGDNKTAVPPASEGLNTSNNTPNRQRTAKDDSSVNTQSGSIASGSVPNTAESESNTSENSVSENAESKDDSAADSNVAMFAAADSAAAGSSSKMRAASGSSVIWNSQTYFGYLGIDVFASIKLPQDMKNTSQNEFYVQLSDDGIPLSDEGVLTFASSSGKSLTLCTSKSDYSDSFSSSGYKNKTLNGVKVYYVDSEGVCNGYMYTGKAGFTFYSLNMSRAELETALISLIK